MSVESTPDQGMAVSAINRPLQQSGLLISNATNQALTLRANFHWTFAGNMVNAVCQWAMLASLARLGSPQAVGQFVYGLAVAAPVTALAMLQLRNVQVTDVRGEYAFADYFGARAVWTFVGLLVIVVWAWLASADAAMFWVILLVGITKSADSLSDIVRGLFQRHEQMDLSGMSLMIKGPAALAALALAMWWTGSVVAAAAAMAAVWIITFHGYDLVVLRRLRRAHGDIIDGGVGIAPRFAWKRIFRLSRVALPLGIVMALISLQTNIPRYVLQEQGGSVDLGFFGAIVYPMMAGMMVVTALGQTVSPRLARHFADDPLAFRKLLIQVLLLAGGLGVLLVTGTAVLGGPVLGVLYGAEYREFDREFLVLAVALGVQFVASGFGYALTAARYFRVQVVLTVMSCLATLIAAWVLVPRYGVMGASLTVGVTSVVMCFTFGVMTYLAYSRRAGIHSDRSWRTSVQE